MLRQGASHQLYQEATHQEQDPLRSNTPQTAALKNQQAKGCHTKKQHTTDCRVKEPTS